MSKEKYTIKEAYDHNTKVSMQKIRDYAKKTSHSEITLISDNQVKIQKSYICLYCRKNKVKIDGSPTYSEFKNNSTMCLDGTVQCIFIGYGSIHDTEKFAICFCDPCLTKLVKKNHILALP